MVWKTASNFCVPRRARGALSGLFSSLRSSNGSPTLSSLVAFGALSARLGASSLLKAPCGGRLTPPAAAFAKWGYASAPATISVISWVMAPWRARL